MEHRHLVLTYLLQVDNLQLVPLRRLVELDLVEISIFKDLRDNRPTITLAIQHQAAQVALAFLVELLSGN